MVVELVLILGATTALNVHLGQLLQRVEDRRDDALVVRVDNLADVKLVRLVQLALDAHDEELE